MFGTPKTRTMATPWRSRRAAGAIVDEAGLIQDYGASAACRNWEDQQDQRVADGTPEAYSRQKEQLMVVRELCEPILNERELWEKEVQRQVFLGRHQRPARFMFAFEFYQPSRWLNPLYKGAKITHTWSGKANYRPALLWNRIGSFVTTRRWNSRGATLHFDGLRGHGACMVNATVVIMGTVDGR